METATTWPSEPASGRGRTHGTSSAEPFDRWFRYPAGFASDYVGHLVEHLDLSEGVLLDCFMGSGVTGTAAFSAGLSFAGIEAHPLVAELAHLKLTLHPDPEALREVALDVVGSAATSPSAHNETDLVSRSFDPDVLKELVGVREAIMARPHDAVSVALKWALLATLRDVASVKVGWPYQRPAVARKPKFAAATARFIARVNMIAEDLELPRDMSLKATLAVGSSADATSWVGLPASDGCITSPPYLNNFDYADATRLELYFWGEVRTWKEMCDTVRTDMIIATTQQSSKALKDAALETLAGWENELGTKITKLTDAISTASRDHGPRGKEYDRVVPSYFTTMERIFTNLERNLKPGARAVWLVGDSAPYGVYVDTPGLIAEVAAQVGLEPEDDVVLRRRGLRWDRGGHPLTERMIVFRKPV